MLTQILGYVNLILAVAGATPDGAKFEQHVMPAIEKAQAVLTGLNGLQNPASLGGAMNDLQLAVGVLRDQNLIPASLLSSGIAADVLSIPAAIHNFSTKQPVPIAPINVGGHAGHLYAIPNDSDVAKVLDGSATITVDAAGAADTRGTGG